VVQVGLLIRQYLARILTGKKFHLIFALYLTVLWFVGIADKQIPFNHLLVPIMFVVFIVQNIIISTAFVLVWLWFFGARDSFFLFPLFFGFPHKKWEISVIPFIIAMAGVSAIYVRQHLSWIEGVFVVSVYTYLFLIVMEDKNLINVKQVLGKVKTISVPIIKLTEVQLSMFIQLYIWNVNCDNCLKIVPLPQQKPQDYKIYHAKDDFYSYDHVKRERNKVLEANGIDEHTLALCIRNDAYLVQDKKKC
jgi:hypothetical protein